MGVFYLMAVKVPELIKGEPKVKKRSVGLVIEALKECGINFVSGLPDGWLRPVHEGVIKDPAFMYVPVCNEGVGFSICAGAWLGGKKTCLIMENSGLRVAAEYIARIGIALGIPVVLLMSYRGDLGDTEHWAVPHGIVVEPLLHALRISYWAVSREDEIKSAIAGAFSLSEASLHPTAVLFRRGVVY